MSMFIIFSTYDDICTVLDQMERENWGGVMGNLATQIKRMLVDSGVNPTQCPFPPQSLRIENFNIHLPEVSAALSSFAAVRYFTCSSRTHGRLDYLVQYKTGSPLLNIPQGANTIGATFLYADDTVIFAHSH